MNNNKEQDLIVTPTNSIKESKGSGLWLEGNQSLYVIGGGVVSFFIIFYGLINKWTAPELVTGFIVPIFIALLYLYFFQINKPPGYQQDLITKLFNGSDFDVRSNLHKQNPYTKNKRD